MGKPTSTSGILASQDYKDMAAYVQLCAEALGSLSPDDLKWLAGDINEHFSSLALRNPAIYQYLRSSRKELLEAIFNKSGKLHAILG